MGGERAFATDRTKVRSARLQRTASASELRVDGVPKHRRKCTDDAGHRSVGEDYHGESGSRPERFSLT
jgi:hypothetical protein